MSTKHVSLSHAELATLDATIKLMEEEGASASSPVAITPVTRVVLELVLRTAAVLCRKTEGDDRVIEEMKRLASSVKSEITLQELIDLRRQAVAAARQTR